MMFILVNINKVGNFVSLSKLTSIYKKFLFIEEIYYTSLVLDLGLNHLVFLINQSRENHPYKYKDKS